MIQLTSRSARSRPSACALALLALPLAGVAPAPVELDVEALGGQVEAYLAETDRSSEGRTARAGILTLVRLVRIRKVRSPVTVTV